MTKRFRSNAGPVNGISVDVRAHAIDRASQRCIDKWQKTRRRGEGLHAWTVRLSGEAIASAFKGDNLSLLTGVTSFFVTYEGIRFTFVVKKKTVTLVTVV